MLFATAVSDLSIADALAEPRYRTALPPRSRRRCSPPRRPARSRSTASTPPISRARSNASSSSTAARRRRTRASTATSRCASGRPSRILDGLDGPLVRRTMELIHEIEAGRRICEVANLELLAAYARCEEWEPRLNAVITMLPPGERAPTGTLHGAVVAVKDNIDVRGVVTTNASTVGVPPPAERDATVVARLRAAGAELLCKTNLLEYAAGSVNPAYGMTFNPRDESANVGRVERRLGRARRGGRLRPRARHRHRRLDPDPGRLLRHRRTQADVRARSARRGLPALSDVRPRRDADPHGRADGHAARRDRERRDRAATGRRGCASASCAASSTTPTSRPACALACSTGSSRSGRRASSSSTSTCPSWSWSTTPSARSSSRRRTTSTARLLEREGDRYGAGTRALLEAGARIDDDHYRAGARRPRADRRRVRASLRAGRRARRADRAVRRAAGGPAVRRARGRGRGSLHEPVQPHRGPRRSRFRAGSRRATCPPACSWRPR